MADSYKDMACMQSINVATVGRVVMDSDVYQYRRDECFMDQVAVGCDKGDGQDLI